MASSSDHLVTQSHAGPVPVGSELGFQLDYCALVRSMSSPFVTEVIKGRTPAATPSR